MLSIKLTTNTDRLLYSSPSACCFLKGASFLWHSWYGSKSPSYSCLNPVITPWLCPAAGCHFPVPLNSCINCLCKFCFTNSAWIWGCWSTLHTPQGGAILRIIHFKIWRDCNLVSQTLRKVQRSKESIIILTHGLSVQTLTTHCKPPAC